MIQIINVEGWQLLLSGAHTHTPRAPGHSAYQHCYQVISCVTPLPTLLLVNTRGLFSTPAIGDCAIPRYCTRVNYEAMFGAVLINTWFILLSLMSISVSLINIIL